MVERFIPNNQGMCSPSQEQLCVACGGRTSSETCVCATESLFTSLFRMYRRMEINFDEMWEKMKRQLYCVLTLTPIQVVTVVEYVLYSACF
jgi:hypothetical protein